MDLILILTDANMQVLIDKERRHIWRNLGEHRSVVGTTDNFPLRENLKALRAAEQQRAMTDNNKRYELKLRPATRYNVAKSART